MKILIVDDNESTQQQLTAFLAAYGRTDCAGDGMEAVEMVSMALDSESPYDLVFMDILMPNKDGQTALREIRHLEHSHNLSREQRSIAIMISALDDVGNMSEAFFHGEASGYLLKPLTRENLESKLGELGIAPRTPQSGPTP